jgi:hypothetical protein
VLSCAGERTRARLWLGSRRVQLLGDWSGWVAVRLGWGMAGPNGIGQGHLRSSGYHVGLTRQRSPARSWPGVPLDRIKHTNFHLPRRQIGGRAFLPKTYSSTFRALPNLPRFEKGAHGVVVSCLACGRPWVQSPVCPLHAWLPGMLTIAIAKHRAPRGRSRI